MKDTGANESVQFKEQERGKEVQYECKLTYLNSIKTDEMFSKMFLSEVQIFKAERDILPAAAAAAADIRIQIIFRLGKRIPFQVITLRKDYYTTI